MIQCDDCHEWCHGSCLDISLMHALDIGKIQLHCLPEDTALENGHVGSVIS